jgi:MOSC domain-containing protein YiiM
MMGYIEAICISEEKGTVKQEISTAVLRPDWGIEGDAHAGNWHRQVSLLAGESIDGVREMIPELERGAFAENLIIRDMDLRELTVGTQLEVGASIVLEITQIGKECHNRCAILAITGDCIMPREGLFAKVVRGGSLDPGDSILIHEKVA